MGETAAGTTFERKIQMNSFAVVCGAAIYRNLERASRGAGCLNQAFAA